MAAIYLKDKMQLKRERNRNRNEILMLTCDTALLSGISVPHWRPKDLEAAIKVDTAGWSRICVTDGDGQPEGTGIRGALTVDSAVTVYCLRCFLLDTGPPFIIHALLPRLTSVNKSTLFVCRLLRKCRKEALLQPLKKEIIYRQERLGSVSGTAALQKATAPECWTKKPQCSTLAVISFSGVFC